MIICMQNRLHCSVINIVPVVTAVDLSYPASLRCSVAKVCRGSNLSLRFNLPLRYNLLDSPRS